MGLLSKAWKGIRSIGSGIVKRVKKTVKSIGKFMNKIGIVGQIAMSMILPGSGELFGMLTKSLLDVSAKGIIGSVARGAGNFLNTAMKAANGVGKVFKDVTSGVRNAVGNVVGATINMLPKGMASGIHKGINKLSFGKISMKSLQDASFDKAWEATQGIFTNTGSNLTTLFKDVTDPSKLNKFSQAIADKQAATIQLKTDDIVKNVNDTLDGKIQIDTPPEINKAVTLQTDVPTRTGWTGGVTDAYKQQAAGAFGTDLTPLDATGQTISTPIAEDLLQEAAIPRDNILGQTSGSGFKPSMDVDVLSDKQYDALQSGATERTGWTGGVTEAQRNQSAGKFGTGKPITSQTVAADPTAKTSLLDKKIWGTDKSIKETIGQGFESGMDSVVRGTMTNLAGLGPKTPYNVSHNTVFNADFSGATGIGLEAQAEQGPLAMNNYLADYTQNNFSFMNEYPYGYHAYVDYMNKQRNQQQRGVVG